MNIKYFDWNKKNVDHISRHSVTPDEAEEVFEDSPVVYKTRKKRYYTLGQADSGRYLLVVFKYLGRGRARVITSRDMNVREKHLYKRRS